MSFQKLTPLVITVLAASLSSAAAGAVPLSVPFDFSKSAIAVDVTIKGAPLHMLLDTGVDPSVIDLARADELGLKVDRKAGGEASGAGDAEQSLVYPSSIEQLAIQGRAFAPFEALAFDMGTLSTGYGRRLDGVLGHSFLVGRTVLIDYGANRLTIVDSLAEAASATKSCRTHWSTPIRSFKDDSIPVIAKFRIGRATAPISLDTGSNGGIALYQGALDLPGVRAALTEQGAASFSGARGVGSAKTYVLNAPVGFGPFSLPAGQAVTVHDEMGSSDTRLANIGNKLFAAMKLQILLDYRRHKITFYGDCG